MDGAFITLLWVGVGGWFLLTCSLALGGSMSAARVLVWTVFYWLIGLDALAVPFSIATSHVHHVGVGWRFVVFFIVPPYLLAVFRLRWLRRRRQTSAPASPSTPAA